MKNAPRGLEGTFRSTAEMERHRAQMADAAIEEQLEVQTAFREHGAKLQSIYDQRQRTEMEIARREQEIKQLKGYCLPPLPPPPIPTMGLVFACCKGLLRGRTQGRRIQGSCRVTTGFQTLAEGRVQEQTN